MVNDDEPSYHVGYGRPPLHSRFQKGQSGNKRGRPKGSLNFATVLRTALSERVTVNERGKPKRMTKFDVAVRQQTNKAAGGDGQALRLLTLIYREVADSPNAKQPMQIVLSEEEMKW